jgi:3-deoxy-manno-octulosonate cytidylyltransferase (CMP-KDO synthetase)
LTTSSGISAGAADLTVPRTVAVIPARYASSRFPGKILARATGRPLIQHAFERAAAARSVAEVVVATDDDRIRAAVEAFGGRVIMTGEHANGTSRIAEAAATIDAALIVNVQGDEPEIDPAAIDLAVAALDRDGGCPMSTVAAPFEPGEDPADPNIVKVVRDQRGRALYFTRALVPHRRDLGAAAPVAPLKHLGMYVYRRPFLAVYAALPATPLERTEALEQLRVLEHGHAIAVAVTRVAHHGIDTPQQYEAFVRRWNARQ